MGETKTIQDVLDLTKSAKFVDYRFMDLPGIWQHFSVPAADLDADTFEDGVGFDGSSIRGWKAINESDMLVVPDPRTAFIDPFFKAETVVLICNIVDPITREGYNRDPRGVAARAESYLQSTGIGDTVYIGPEAEFFIFDDVRFDQNSHEGYYHIDSIEGRWNSGRDEDGNNRSYKPRYKEGYFPVPPMDKFQDLRSEMVLKMQDIGLVIEAQHHEVGTAGQAEIDLRFSPLLEMSDAMAKYKYVVRNVADQAGHTATFMPKPLFEDNGSGMHTHISIWKDGTNLFAGDQYAGLSEGALHGIGGILKHAPALLAFTNPTTNSYKRLVPGYEAPVNLAYSKRNRSACCRIPMYSESPHAKRIEFRCPDPSCNPYLAFSALLMATLDGIQNKIDPGKPLDRDIYEMTRDEMREMGIRTTPGSLEEAIDALEKDHAFLTRGDVFTEDLVRAFIDYKREKELDPMRLRPHPYEFYLYYDN